ncbi:MAG: hypothetical protein ACLQPH_16655 [Acidimicrobiales bacterium]
MIIVNLSEALAVELSDVLGEVIRDMSSEIADTDNAAFRAKLKERRERLASIRSQVDESLASEAT